MSLKVNGQAYYGLKLVRTGVPKGEQVTESQHWAIQQGDISLPGSDLQTIAGHVTNMNLLFKVLCRLYVGLLVAGELHTAARVLRCMRHYEDPYMPDIGCCLNVESEENDPFLDLAQRALQDQARKPRYSESKSKSPESSYISESN